MISEKYVESLNDKFSDGSPEDILRWCFDEFHPNIALATSFQAQGMVLIDMFMNISREARIFTIDTGRLDQETYDIFDKIRAKYNKNIEVLFPDHNEVQKMVSEKGMNLFYESVENRMLCCGIRKSNPLDKYLKTLDGWITAIRNEQSDLRSDIRKFEIDTLHGGY